MATDEPRWLDPEERTAWLSAAALIVRLPAALDSQLQADAGLSFFEYMVLSILSEREDRTLQMSDLARAASASLSRLSHTARRLEQQGYLTRARTPGAGRRTAATLTDAGFDKVARTAPGHVEQVRRLLIDAVDPADLAALHRVASTVVNRMDEPPPEWFAQVDP